VCSSDLHPPAGRGVYVPTGTDLHDPADFPFLEDCEPDGALKSVESSPFLAPVSSNRGYRRRIQDIC
jgi:hypothetical protein